MHKFTYSIRIGGEFEAESIDSARRQVNEGIQVIPINNGIKCIDINILDLGISRASEEDDPTQSL